MSEWMFVAKGVSIAIFLSLIEIGDIRTAKWWVCMLCLVVISQ